MALPRGHRRRVATVRRAPARTALGCLLVALATGIAAPAAATAFPRAVVATRSALTLTLIYMWSVSMIFFLAPGMLCDLFASGRQDPSDFAAVRAMAVNLIKLVAFYSLMDALAVIYSGALKGAGDTRFIGFMTVLLSIFVMIVPVYVAVLVLHAGLYTAWGFVTLYVCLADMAFFLRFRNGRWKHIRVIERACVDT